MQRISLLLLLPGIYLIGFSFYRGLGVTIYDVFIISSFFSWIVLGFRGFDFSLLRNGLFPSFLLAVCGYIISTPASSNQIDSLVQILKFCFSIVIFFIYFPSVINTERDWISASFAAAASGAINGIGAVLQATVGLGALTAEPFWGRMSGFTEHPNELGFHTAISIFICFILFAICKSKLERFLAVGLMACASCGLILSSSISCIAALAISGVVVAILESINRRFEAAKGLLVVSVLILFAILLLSVFNEDNSIAQRITAQQSLDTNDGTLGARFITYELAYERILENPFIGVGASEDDTLSVIGDYVHNMFLRAFREGGLFAFLGMIFIYFSVFKLIFNSFKADTLGNYFVGLIVVVFICAFFSPAFFQRMYWLPFGLLISAAKIRIN